jgi:hypothetical protein
LHKIFIFAAFGWLTLTGALHFIIDVVSQYLRGKRLPGPETTLYFGLNTAYALGQVMFGLLGLWVAWQALDVLGQWPAMALCLAATIAWLVFSFVFLGYREPKFMIAIFGVLIVAAALTA